MADPNSSNDAQVDPNTLPLEDQVAYWRRAYANSPINTDQNATAANILAGKLADLHTERGETGAILLNEALALLHNLRESFPTDYTAQGQTYATIANINHTAYSTTDQIAYLQDSISWGRRAANEVDSNLEPSLQAFLRARRQSRLARALVARYLCSDGQLSGQTADFDEAIILATGSVHSKLKDWRDREMPERVGVLCWALLLRARFEGQLKYLRDAIAERQRHEDHSQEGRDGLCPCGVELEANQVALVDLLGFHFGLTLDNVELENLLPIARVAFEGADFGQDGSERAGILRILADRAEMRTRQVGWSRMDRLAAIALYFTYIESLVPNRAGILRRENEALCELTELFEQEWEANKRDEDALSADYVSQWSALAGALSMEREDDYEFTPETFLGGSVMTLCGHHLGGRSFLKGGAPIKPPHLRWTVPLLPGMREGTYERVEDSDDDGDRNGSNGGGSDDEDEGNDASGKEEDEAESDDAEEDEEGPDKAERDREWVDEDDDDEEEEEEDADGEDEDQDEDEDQGEENGDEDDPDAEVSGNEQSD